MQGDPSSKHTNLPLWARALLAVVPLGDRRVDVSADLADLFAQRARDHGRWAAERRLISDIASVTASARGRGTALQDVRFALRLFGRHPTVIAVTVGGLAMAIAVTTSVFTILHASLLRPYGISEPESVFAVHRAYHDGSSTTWPYRQFRSLRTGARLADVEAMMNDRASVTGAAGDPDAPIDRVMFVSGGYLQMLGARASLGRTLASDDDRPGAAPVAVLNHELWRLRFAADPAIIGRTVRVAGSLVTVVGVLAPDFSGPSDNPPAMWAPFASYGSIYRVPSFDQSTETDVEVLARIRSGVTMSAAEAQLSSVAAAIASADAGGGNAPQRLTGVRMEAAGSRTAGPDGWIIYSVLAAILVVLGLVLALACANVANLLLASAGSRSREIGVRLAMGASRGRIVRQLLTESLLMGLGAGVVGFAMSYRLVPALGALVGVPPTVDLSPDLPVLWFAMTVAALAGLGAGLAPARFGARGDVLAAIKSENVQAGSAPRASRARRFFIGFQAAASMVLVVMASLFTRAALHVTSLELGFDAKQLLAVSAIFPSGGETAKGGGIDPDVFWRAAIERVGALPSVERVSLAQYSPFSGRSETRLVTNAGMEYRLSVNRTDATYFSTAGLRVIRGRAYTDAEVSGGAPVALVSERVAHDLLAGRDPIGEALRTATQGSAWDNVVIIGVVADAVTSRVEAGGSGAIYLPIGRRQFGEANLIVRSTAPGDVVQAVRSALVAVDRRVRADVTVMATSAEIVRREPRILASLTGGVAVLALTLAVLGVYGVTSFAVNQRAQEMSVRMAIGASAGDVVRLLVRDSLRPVAVGLGAGLALALGGSRVLTTILAGVDPHDPLAIGSAIAVLLVSAVAAVAGPAMRAARTNPALALRT